MIGVESICDPAHSYSRQAVQKYSHLKPQNLVVGWLEHSPAVWPVSLQHR